MFTLYNVLGGITWAILFGTLGYAFGRNLPRLERYAGHASLAVALLVTVIVALALAARWFRANRIAIADATSRLWQRAAKVPALAAIRTRHPRVWTFVSARFARGEYLGLHLTIGLLVSLAALWLFGGVTEGVVHNDPLARFDLTLADLMHARTTHLGYAVFNAISLAGSPAVMAALALAVTVILAVRHRWIIMGGWIAAFAGAGVLNSALKRTIARPRPSFGAAFLHGESFSFPSGHAMGSLVAYGMLTYFLVTFWTHNRRWQVPLVIAATMFVIAIGFSRLYLGVHYFSDVVGGYAAGIVWLAACISGVEIARRQPS